MEYTLEQQKALAMARARQRMAQQKAPEKQDTSIGRTVFDQTGQGLTFGLMDEGQDILGALGAKAYDKISGENVLPSLSETVKMARHGTRDRLAQQLQENPGTSIASNIAGSLITGGALATTAPGKAVADSLRSGGLGARALKGAATGAASGGAYGLGTGEDSLQDRMQSAGRGAVLGGVVGAAAPVVAAGFNKSLGKTVLPTADELRKKSGDAYKLAEQKGGTLKSGITDEFVDKIQRLKPQTDIGKLVGGDSPFTKVVDRISAIKGKPITLEAAQELDELLGDAVDDFTELGRLTKQGKKILDIQTTFRNMIEDADEGMVEGGKEGFAALKEARKIWADSRKMADVERIMARAELTDNAATSIKTGFRTLLSNPNRIKGYSPAERKAIEKAANSGVVGDALRTMLGSRLIASLMGLSGGGPVGAAAGATMSIAARGGAEALQAGRAQKVAEAIAGKYAQRGASQPALRSLSSYIPQTPGIIPGSTSEQIARLLMQPQ